MKKIFTTICLLTASIFGYGQTSAIVMDMGSNDISNTIYEVYMGPSSSGTIEVLVKNTSSAQKLYKCKRYVYTVDAADLTQFCWGGLCYGYTTNVSSKVDTIGAGVTDDFNAGGFHAIMNTSSVSMTRTVHYQIYNTADALDTVGFTLRYHVGVGVEESQRSGSISAAYPNPTNSFMSVKYDINELAQTGRISMFDMLGKKVKDVVLTDKEGTAKFNVADLNPGIYFYTFFVDDKAITTKKMVITAK